MRSGRVTDLSRTLLDYMPAAVAIFDRDMRFLDVSSHWLSLYPMERQNVIGHNYYDLFPDIPKRWKDVHRRCIAGATERNESDHFIDSDGKTQWRRWEVRPWYLDSGDIGGIVIFTDNITGHKQIEFELATNAAVLMAEQEASPDGILVVDEQAIIISINSNFIKMWGIPAALVEAGLDTPVIQFALNQVADPDAFLARVNYFYAHPAESGEDEILLRDGRVIERHSTPITHSDGKYLGRVWFFRDITARKQASERLKRALVQTIEAVASIIEIRDPYTAGHGRQVATISVAIANKMELDAERVNGLRLAAIVHDLGKVALPAEILSKPSRLTPTEYQLVQTHVELGYDVLQHIEFSWPIADIVRQHHERLDGSGYPRGLSGDAILLEARILAVADVVDSIMSHRPYRPALGLEAALAEIKDHSGKLYDPAVVAACLQVMRHELAVPMQSQIGHY